METGPGSAYAVAFLDWLACACAGSAERAARAARTSGDDAAGDVAFAATAGHVLDYDDTFSAGVAHVSAACAPAALVLAARLERTVGDMLDAYAGGFEAMAAVAAASQPALYDGGWHPTAVCGPIGAAVVAAALLDLAAAQRESALGIAVLRAGGTRGAFGSDGKAIQVGLAAAAGVQAALLARGGAVVDLDAVRGPLGFQGVLGATWPAGVGEGGSGERAIDGNWIKLHPSCLGTHAPIQAAARAREDGHRLGDERVEVRVGPVALQAAHIDRPRDGLSAKFSIPYCVARTLRDGPPGVADFAALDPEAAEQARLVEVVLDETLPRFGAVLGVSGRELVRVACPQGAPEQPVSPAALRDKVRDLAGDRLDGLLDDPDAPARGVWESFNEAAAAGAAGGARG